MADQGFPPASRLRTDRDFSRVFNRQQKAAGRHVVALVRPHDPRHPGQPRLGIMVAVKTARLAVRRHQLKRWVRECFRLRLRPLLGGHDLVVLFRSDPPDTDDAHARLDEELVRLVPAAMAAKPQPRGGGRR
ncbi:MAG: ribonuclease protein component [Planctomycetota bacterium]|jgi:ribonuclease P protein component